MIEVELIAYSSWLFLKDMKILALSAGLHELLKSSTGGLGLIQPDFSVLSGELHQSLSAYFFLTLLPPFSSMNARLPANMYFGALCSPYTFFYTDVIKHGSEDLCCVLPSPAWEWTSPSFSSSFEHIQEPFYSPCAPR